VAVSDALQLEAPRPSSRSALIMGPAPRIYRAPS